MSVSRFLPWLWKRKWRVALGGAVVMLLMMCVTFYHAAYSYSLRVSYVYPAAVSGLYPDGKRFLAEDLVGRERVQQALAEMQAKGWYADMTLKEILSGLSVSEYLTSPVQQKVDALRMAGQEYTYYNNEYSLSFTQANPVHIKGASHLFGIFRENRSKEFLETLYRVNAKAFLREHTEGAVFQEFSGYLTTEGADYDQIAEIYDDKLALGIQYLGKKQAEANNFVSAKTGHSFGDLIIAFQSLRDVEVNRLHQYVTASKLTRQLDERVNRYKVDIEQTELLQSKKADEAAVTTQALMTYDHTFSENIVVVAMDEAKGLYQARPKTAYDTLTQRALNAEVAANNAKNQAAESERLLGEYQLAMGDATTAANTQRLADEMVAALETKYQALTQSATQTIEDYVGETNMHYMETTAMPRTYVGPATMARWALGFCLGATLVALICFAFDKRREQADTSSRQEGRRAA